MNAERLKALILDDEPVIADTLVLILNMHGYDSLAMYDPFQALEWLRSNPCDILLSDVIFDTSITGIDVAIEVRTLLPNCKILLMSGNNSTAELLQKAVGRGYSFEILAKPVPPADILAHLKSPGA